MKSFFDGEFHHAELPGLRQLDWDAFRGHTMSLSVSPRPGHPGHQAFQHALRCYFDTYARDGISHAAHHLLDNRRSLSRPRHASSAE